MGKKDWLAKRKPERHLKEERNRILIIRGETNRVSSRNFPSGGLLAFRPQLI